METLKCKNEMKNWSSKLAAQQSFFVMSQPILDVSENWFCRLVSRFRGLRCNAEEPKRSDNTRVVLLQKSLRVLQK